MDIMTTASILPSRYTFHDAPPSLEIYLALRELDGLTAKSPEQGQGAITGSWAWCTILYTPPSSSSSVSNLSPLPEVVGMVRAIGDGGWYFVIADMAVQTAHRRKGLGESLLRRMLATIEERAPPHALISLLAGAPGRVLYRKLGFVGTVPACEGMWMLDASWEEARKKAQASSA